MRFPVNCCFRRVLQNGDAGDLHFALPDPATM